MTFFRRTVCAKQYSSYPWLGAVVVCLWLLSATSASASLTQTAFQFRQDNGSETAATNLSVQNANTTWPLNQLLRARVQVSSSVATTTPFFLQFRKQGDTRWDTVNVNDGFPVVTATSSGRTTGNATSHNITLPVCAVGNLLVVVFSHDGAGTSLATSAGWQKLGEQSNGIIVTGAIYWKFSSSTDTLSITTADSEESSHIVYCVRGAAAPLGVAANGNGTNSNPPSLATGAARSYLWIATRAGDSTVVATVAPSGFGSFLTQAANTTGGASTNAAHLASSTATLDPGTFTSATEQWVSYTIAVPPAHTPTNGSLAFSEGKAPSTSVNNTGIGSIAWSNPGNAVSSNNSHATLTVSSTTASNYLFLTGFGHQVPQNATILGIEAQIERFRSGGTTGEARDNNIRLVKAGAVVGSSLATATNWPTTAAVASYGSPTNLWGTSWTPAEVNASDFGIAIAVQGAAAGANRIANVDHVIVNVYYTLPSPIRLASSTFIATAGASTTALMSPPTGLGTSDFDAGRISDDTNPSIAVSIDANDYSEFEWNLVATGTAQNGDIYELRLARGATSSLDVYNTTAEWTVGQGIVVTGTLYGEDGTTPLSGRTVVAAVGTSTPSRHSTTTDAQGRYTITSISTSTIGVWATSSAAGNNDFWTSVTYGNGRFVAVGSEDLNNDLVMYSDDGVTWVTTSAAGNDDVWSSLTYGNGRFVAVGQALSLRDSVMYSDDGVTWATTSAAGNNDLWTSVTYGNGRFVAVGGPAFAGNDAVMYSDDGITWTASSAAGNNDYWSSVTFGNGRFVAVSVPGFSDDTVMYSDDGITWATTSAAGNNDFWTSVTFGNGRFVAVGASETGVDDFVMYSNDGIYWATTSAAGNNDGWSSVTFGNGYFVAVGCGSIDCDTGSGDRLMYSTNGVTWATTSVAGDNDIWRSVTFGNGRFVAVGHFPGDVVMRTTAGFGEDTPITLFVDENVSTPSSTASTLTYGVTGIAGGYVRADLIADIVTIKKESGNGEVWLSDADVFDGADDTDILFTATTSTTTIHANLHIAPGTVVYAPQHLVIDGNFTNLGTFYPERGEVIADARTHDARQLRLQSDNDIETVTLVGVHVSPDGRNLHYWDSNENLEWYRLPVPFDTSSTTFQNATDTTALGTDVRDIHFKPDGTALYTVNTSGTLFQFSLSTPWDVSTLTLVATTSPTGGSMNGIEFNPEGTTMFIMDRFGGDSIEQWRLSTPWNITTATFVARNSASLWSWNEQGIEVNPQGTRLYVLGQNGTLAAHELTTPWDITTLTPYTYFTEDLVDGDSFAMMIDDTGSNLYISGATNDEIKHFKLDEPQTFVGVNALHDFTGTADSGVTLSRSYTLTGNYTNTGVATNDPNGLITLTSTSTFMGNLTGSSSLPAVTATGTARVTIGGDFGSAKMTVASGAVVNAASATVATIRGGIENAGTLTLPQNGTLTLTGNLSNPGTLNASTTDITFTGSGATLSGGLVGSEALADVTFTAATAFATSGFVTLDLNDSQQRANDVYVDETAVYLTGYCNDFLDPNCGNGRLSNKIYTAAVSRATGAMLWSEAFGLTDNFEDGEGITGDDEFIYVTGYASNFSSFAYYFTKAINKETGVLAWSSTTTIGSAMSYAYDVAVDDTTVYVTGYCISCGTLGGDAWLTVAYDKTNGATLWTTIDDVTVNSERAFGVTVGLEAVYVTGYCEGCGTVGDFAVLTRAYDPASGAMLWSVTNDTTAFGDSASAITYDDNVLYIGASENDGEMLLLALSASDGSFLWSTTSAMTNGYTWEGVATDGTNIYVTTTCYSSCGPGFRSWYTEAISKETRNLLWSDYYHPSPFNDNVFGLAVMGDDLYVAGECGECVTDGFTAMHVVAYDKTSGEIRNGTQNVAFGSNASTAAMTINASSTVTTPSALTIAGDFTQNGNLNASTTTQYFTGFAHQDISGNLVGTNALGDVVFGGTKQKRFVNNASTSDFTTRDGSFFGSGTDWTPGDVNILDQPGGITVVNDIAYIPGNVSDNLAIVSVASATNPVLLGNWDPNNTNTMDFANDVVVQNNVAYVAGGNSDNLALVNVASSTNPVLLANWDPNNTNTLDSARAVTVVGNYAYVAGFFSDNLAIVDISSSTNPTLTGNWDPNNANTMDGPADVEVEGNFAYILGGTSRNLAIVDISNPASPVLRGNYDPNDTSILSGPDTLAVEGNYAYITDDAANTLVIVDVSSSTNPTLVHVWNTSSFGSMWAPFSLVVEESFAYVVARSTTGVTIFDVSNPTRPEIVIEDRFTNTETDIFVDDEYMYVTSSLDDTFRIIPLPLSVKGPSALSVAGDFTLATSSAFQAGTTTYFTGTNQEIAGQVFERADMRDVVITGSSTMTNGIATEDLTIASGATLAAPTSSLVVYGDYLNNGTYLNRGGDLVAYGTIAGSVTGASALGAVSLTGTSSKVLPTVASTSQLVIAGVPEQVAYYNSGDLTSVSSMVVRNNIAYLIEDFFTAATSTVRIVDVSSSTNPVQISTWTPTSAGILDGAAFDSELVGNFLYISSHQSDALVILNVSNPSNPTLAGVWDPNDANVMDGPLFIDVVGNFAYIIGDVSNTVAIVNVSNPANPQLAGLYDPDDSVNFGSPYDIYVRGNYAYVSSVSNTLENLTVLNVSSSTNPTLVTSVNSIGSGAFVGQGDYVYILGNGSDNKFAVVSVASATNPVIVGTYPFDSLYDPSTLNLTVDGQFVYIVEGFKKLVHVFDVSTPTNPMHVTRFKPTGPSANAVNVISYYDVDVENGFVYLGHNAFGTLTILRNNSLTATAGTALSVTNSINNASTFIAPTTTYLGGSFANSGTFEHGGGTILAQGSATQTFSGILTATSALNALTVSNTSGNGSTTFSVVFADSVTTEGTYTMLASTSAQFTAGATSTFQNVDWQGSSTEPIYLRSSSPGNQWYLDIPGSQLTVEYVSVEDSNASSTEGGVIATNSTDLGNNSNWCFPGCSVSGPQPWNATDWTLYDTITIDAANIDATLTDFPVYVNLADLSSQFWATTPAGAGTVGTDIRVTNASNQELPRELVFASSTAETGELHFKADSISSTTDTVFKIWYNGTTTGDYARDATYGTENVWTNEYVGVWHLGEEGNNNAGGYFDSTSNANHGTGTSMMSTSRVSSKLGFGQDLDGVADYISVPASPTIQGLNSTGFTVSAWMNAPEQSSSKPLISRWNETTTDRIWVLEDVTAGISFSTSNNGSFDAGNRASSSIEFSNSWVHVAGVYETVDNIVYVNNASYARDRSSDGLHTDVSLPIIFGYAPEIFGATNRFFDGVMDEVRIASTTRSAAWISAEYLNQSTTTNFYTVGVGGAFAGTTTLANHDASQVNNAFSFQNVTNGALFAFKLTPESGPATTTNTVIALAGAQNVQASDFSNIRLLRDNDNDAAFDAGDTVLDATGVMSLTGQQGTITFDSDFGVTTTRNYLVVADWNAPQNGSFLSLDLWPNGLTIENATGTLLVVGDVASVQHRRNNQGGGGGSARIGGDAPAGDGVVGGGSNEGGEQIGSNPDFFWPTANTGSWTNPANAYDQVDGTYATANSGVTNDFNNFNDTVPGSDTIQGIEIRLEVSGSTAAGSIGVELSWNGGTNYTTSGKTTGTLTATDTVVTLGGPADTWGRAWTPGDFSNANFRVRLTGNPSSNTVRVDAIQVRVYHQASGGSQGGGGGGGAI